MTETRVHQNLVDPRETLDRPLVPPAQTEKYFFDPSHDEPRTIALLDPILDLHGNVMIPAELVSPDDHRAKHVFQAGRIIEVDPVKDHHLANFLRTHRSFRRAKHTDAA